jgi:hypothetical protein
MSSCRRAPQQRRGRSDLPLRSGLAAALLALSGAAAAFTVTISPGALTGTLYLQIGVGNGGTFQGGNLGTNATQNTESVTVPATALGRGTAQAMTTNSNVTTSAYNGRTFCTVPGQLYIGAYYQVPLAPLGWPSTASVRATVPAALTDASGDTISFSRISWTSSGIGDSGAEVFPAGTFAAGTTQAVGTLSQNQWGESCWTFSYANTTVPPAGTYTGIVLYTLSDP